VQKTLVETMQDPCRVGSVLHIIGGRWQGAIIWWLRDGTKRFGELRRHIPGVSQTVLTTQLRQLERDGLVHREQFDEMPVRVEYSLTDLGRSLLPILDDLRDWALQNLEAVERARAEANGDE
jgi:DNA-binding HxlR family transcriptional regulator